MSELQQQDIPKVKSERTVSSSTVLENSSGNGNSYGLVFPELPESKGTGAKTIGTNSQCVTGNVPSKGMSKVRTTIVNQVFTISSQDRKSDKSKNFDEGESKRICRQIVMETGAEIEISTSKNMNLTFLVRGKEVDVVEAKRRIIARLQTQVTSAVSVPKEHRFQVIGKQGKRRKEIEQRTGVRIQMPSIQDTSDIINVTGTRDAVETAVQEIRMISEELSKKTFEMSEIPKVFNPLIIGENNQKQNALMKEIGDKIQVPSLSVNTDKIKIEGDKGVQSTIETIEQINTKIVKESPAVFVKIPKHNHKHIMAQNGKGLPILYKKINNISSETIECPAWIHRFLIGKNGSNLKELIEDNRKINVEFLENNKIIVKGPTNMIPKVTESLKKGIACYDSAELVIDRKLCKHIIGKNGSNINRVKNDTGVTINISDSANNSNIIRIEGRKDGVQLAKSALKETIYKIENKVEKEISIDQSHHRAIIGIKGEKVRELQKVYNVQITFPNSVETKSNLVKVRGLNNDVNKALESLAKLANELDEANYILEILVVKRFHRLVIGKGGTNIRKIREETGTKIDIPHEGEDSDIIKVIGHKEKVLIACHMIKEIVNEMKIIVTKEIVLRNVKVRNIIVNLGNKFIQSIKEDFGRNVTLKLPAVKGDNTIVMKGPENDVDCASSQIQTMDNEFHNSVIDLKVKREFHKYLIGNKRTNVKRIRDLTNTIIMFPPGTDSIDEKITIIGKKEDVNKARAEFEVMIVEISNVIEEHVEINKKYHKSFVAKRGEFLHKLEDECGGVIILFPKPDAGDKVIIKGTKSNVALAKKRLLDHVNILLTDLLKNEARVDLKAKPDTQSVSIGVTDPKHKGNVGFVMGNGAQCEKAHPDTNSNRDLPSSAGIVTVASNDRSDQTTSPPSLDISKLESERTVSSSTVLENSCGNGNSYGLVFPELPESKGTGAKNIGTNSQCVTGNVPSKGMSKVRNTIVNQVFTISSQDRKSDKSKNFDEGESKRICSQIVMETGAEIEISTSKNMNMTFLVRGKEVDVVEAKRRIIARLQTQVTSAVSVPKEHRFQVIGKQGKRRKEIEQRTGVRIQMPSIQDTSDIINVTGTRDAVETAVREIRMISEELSKKKFEMSEIPKVFNPIIIGDNNQKQNALMKETSDKIQVPSLSVNTDKIKIEGDKGVQSTIETIEQINTKIVKESPAVFVKIPKHNHKHIMAQNGKGLPILYKKINNISSETIECPAWIHRFLIGKNGSNLKELIEDNRKINVEFLENNKIIVKGPTNMIPKVTESLKKGIACYDSAELVIDRKLCKYIIGKNGSNINRVKNDNGVTINISDSANNSNIIRIEGRKDGVQLAKSALKETIYKIENKVEKEISIDQSHHRAIIGIKGEKVRELQKVYNVQITFPNSVETKSNLVKVRGLNNDVNKALESLAKLANELDEANYILEILVVKRFHRLVIGKGGTNIRKIREETGTKIDIPHEGEDSDIIKVIGHKEKVLIACHMIKEIVNEMKIIVTKEIVLRNVKVRNIIVNLGNKFIQSIKEDFGRNVTLKLPAVKGDNTIVMKGPENDVDCASSQIQTMENECHNSVIDLKVKPEFHKYLIGKERANVKRIRGLTNTRIIFPPGNNSTNERITIIGKKENVDKARAEFEDMMVNISNVIDEYVKINK